MSDVSQHEAVAEEVRALMGRRRVSQARLARQLGWTPFYLGRRVNGQTPLDVNDLYALARALDVAPTAFFPGEDRPQDRTIL